MTIDALTAADWGGSAAAALSIVLLFRKSLWYWYVSIVATLLWFYLFLRTQSPMVAGLQLSYTLLALYGIVRWRLQARGRRVPGWLDHAGAGVAALIFAVTVAVAEFADWPSYVELAAVALSILATWLTAMKVIWCWPVWIATNVLFAVLFWHHELWGVFGMQFLYAGLSVVGFRTWLRDGRRVGLVVGKFAPLHRGHQALIERALAETDATVVAVYETPGCEPPAERRARWVRALYPSADVLVLPDPEPSGSDEAVSAAYADHFRAHYSGAQVTHVFSSEDYGERFAAHLGAEHVLVDRERRRVPVSATTIRAAPHAHRRFLDPLVYRDLVRRICFVGAESTGKTTLAAALAERYDTVWMAEYGRELYELKQGRLVFDDLLAIAREHRRREDALALEANRFLFCDTNAVTTVFWSRFYFGRVDSELDRLADEVAAEYEYVLCRNDFPYVQDGWRETGGGPEWHAHQEEIRADLERRGLAYLEVGGALDERLEAASRWLEAAGRRDPAPEVATGRGRG